MKNFKKLILRRKNIQATLLLSVSYMALLVLSACIENVDFNPFGECSKVGLKSNLKDFEVLYQPYKNGKYSTEADKVIFKDFRFNFNFTIEQISQSSSTFNFPGNAYALSCAALYDVRNLSNIAIILAAPYEGIQTGTDISYLFESQNDIRLSEFRDFSKISSIISLTLQRAPTSNTKLKTKTIVFFKNGTQKIVESTSPTLLIN
jgi:hypothetical protein|tara:strand:- start:1432 stop:2046 length:615 start_codon:yes stop_codon:yes gene_type:complete